MTVEGDAQHEDARVPRLLVADDDEITRGLLAEALRMDGYEVVVAEGGQEAVTAFARGGFDVVLLDAVMPRVSGIEAGRTIKAVRGDEVVPVLVLHAKSDVESRVAALEMGADGTVAKPVEPAELARAVASALRVRRAHADLTRARSALEEARGVDPVTGARSFADLGVRLERELARAERHSEPLACCLLDVDGLKVHNERGGRAFGDAVLRRVADAVRGSLRESDVVLRYGADELFVMLPATQFAGALVVASRIRKDASATAMRLPKGGEVTVSVSMGVALFPSRDVRTRRALASALEAALAEAKRRGGNRLCVFQHAGSIHAPEEPSEGRGQIGPATVQAVPGPARS